MSRERIIVFAIALSFYALGGWSLYGELDRQHALATGEWRSTDAMITEAYRRDMERHELKPHSLLGYKYIVRAGGDPARPDYSTGFGLIGIGTLIALVRELFLRRSGRYRDSVPLAWQNLRTVLNKKL